MEKHRVVVTTKPVHRRSFTIPAGTQVNAVAMGKGWRVVAPAPDSSWVGKHLKADEAEDPNDYVVLTPIDRPNRPNW